MIPYTTHSRAVITLGNRNLQFISLYPGCLHKFDEISGKFPYCKYEVMSQTVEEVQFSFRDLFSILTSVVK